MRGARTRISRVLDPPAGADSLRDCGGIMTACSRPARVAANDKPRIGSGVPVLVPQMSLSAPRVKMAAAKTNTL